MNRHAAATRDRRITARRVRTGAVAALLAAGLAALGLAGISVAPGASAASPACGTANAALNRPATASSVESGQFPASAAVDGSTSTRWSSAWSDPQWLQVDLGSSQSICQVVLDWQNPADATAFQIQVSPDATNWTPIYSTTTGSGGVQTLSVTGSGRYIRMYGTARASGYGYSLYEFQVFTGSGPTPTPTPTPTPSPTPTGASVVKVTGSSLGNYGLTVNGAPYQMKGVTFGPANATAAAYLPDLHAMGVNTIRNWGTDASTQSLLDAAGPYGIKVINGFWLGQTTDYVNDSAYKSSTLTSILQWVNTYKNNPSVLMWDIGNEVLLNLPHVYSGAQLVAEDNAYTQYVNQVAAAIHQADPNHPVTSTEAWRPATFNYYQVNAPNLDLIAVNDYGDICNLKQNWASGGFTKPYIVTESGPAGEWEVPNDANGVPLQETDQQNAAGYASAWGCITGNPGISLGGTLFNYDVQNDFGGVWFNLKTGGLNRLSYFQVARMFGGSVQSNTPPVITGMAVTPDTAVPAGGQFTVSVNVSDPNSDPLRYNLMYSSKYVDGSTGLQSATFAQAGPGTFTVTAPRTLGVWKVYVYVYDGQGNLGVQSESFRVVAPSGNGTNVALGKPTTASSYQATGNGAPYPPGNATDGNDSTRWSSAWSDPQWLQADLGQVTTIGHIQLIWESAYAKAYQIQVSSDGTNWTTIYSTTSGSGGVEDFNVTGSGRYVRFYGTARATTYGYSLYEFGVYH